MRCFCLLLKDALADIVAGKDSRKHMKSKIKQCGQYYLTHTHTQGKYGQ